MGVGKDSGGDGMSEKGHYAVRYGAPGDLTTVAAGNDFEWIGDSCIALWGHTGTCLNENCSASTESTLVSLRISGLCQRSMRAAASSSYAVAPHKGTYRSGQ